MCAVRVMVLIEAIREKATGAYLACLRRTCFVNKELMKGKLVFHGTCPCR